MRFCIYFKSVQLVGIKGVAVRDSAIWYMSCFRLTHFYFSLLGKHYCRLCWWVYRFSRLLIRYLAVLRSFVIFGVAVPGCGVNLCPFVGCDYGRFQFQTCRLHLVIRFRTCSLSGCFVDGDLSFASQTGRSTTDIQSNGWIKYQRVRQKRKQINMIGGCSLVAR